MPSYEPVTALLRGLDVLRAVNRLEGATVKDIHRLTGLNQPAVVRMLETLIHAGLVVRQRGQAVYVPTGRTLGSARAMWRTGRSGSWPPP
ncbi:helix-turn-helix domain-containing protein [Pseudoroseomonas wenyumeiae]